MSTPTDRPSESSSRPSSGFRRSLWSPSSTSADRRYPRCHKPPPRISHIGQLNEDEIAAIRLIARGLLLDDIPRRLGISERTLRRRIRALCGRLEARTPIEVIVWAAKRGLV